MNTKDLPRVDIYSDGGANPNPGPGGYGVILVHKGVKKELSQGYTRTTNNRMELTGAITGLSQLKVRSKVTLHTDSQYTINGIQKGWAAKWKANNWVRAKGQKAVNHDLWAIFLDLTTQHELSFEWIKGHNGHIENERCDELATAAMLKNDLIEDTGYIEAQPSPQPSPSKERGQTMLDIAFEKTGTDCKKCQNPLVKKTPKHTKKTLLKAYYYEYYHHCPACKTNYMLEEAKRDIKSLKI